MPDFSKFHEKAAMLNKNEAVAVKK
jgi:hypothetical protein